MPTTTIQIAGMHCQSCVQRARTALEKVPRTAVTDVQLGSAQIQSDDPQAPTHAIAALEKIGFDAAIRIGGH